MKSELTRTQLMFIEKAVNLDFAVINYDVTDEEFENDYGVTKQEMKDEISDIPFKLQVICI